MRYVFLIALASVSALLTTSCARSYRDTTLYHRSGGTKPIVAVLPVIDHAQSRKTPWALADELTAKIQMRIFDSSKLYLLKGKGDLEIANLLNVPDPQAIPSGIEKNLGAAEFAIVTELLDQKEVAYSHPKASEGKKFLNEIGGQIQLSMRVRVVDLRKEKPRVILQEIVQQNHEVSRAYLNVDYNKHQWGDESYERTPLGIAHNKLVRELVAHTEGYIGANRG